MSGIGCGSVGELRLVVFVQFMGPACLAALQTPFGQCGLQRVAALASLWATLVVRGLWSALLGAWS